MLSNESITHGTLKNRFFILVCITSFANNFAINSVNASFSLYMNYLGAGPGVTGMIAFPFLLFAMAGRFSGSYLADHSSRRLVMVVGSILYAVCVLFCGLFSGIAIILIFRAVQGLGYASTNTGCSAANVDTSPPEKLSLVSSLFYVVTAAGIILCGIVIVPFIEKSAFFELYVMIASILLLGAVCSFLCNYEKFPEIKKWMQTHRVSSGNPSEGYRGLSKFFDKSALRPSVVAFTQSIGLGVILTFIFLFGAQANIPHYGHFYTIGAAVAIICNLFISSKISRDKPRRLLIPPFTFMGISLILLGITHSAVFYFISAVAYGVIYGFCFPTLYAVALRGVPVNRRGAASGTLLIANDLGVGVGAPLLGLCAGSFGFHVTFVLTGCVYLLAMVFSVALFGEKRAQHAN